MALVGSRVELDADEDIFEDALETISRCQALLMKCVLPHWAPKAVSGAVDALVGNFQNG